MKLEFWTTEDGEPWGVFAWGQVEAQQVIDQFALEKLKAEQGDLSGQLDPREVEMIEDELDGEDLPVSSHWIVETSEHWIICKPDDDGAQPITGYLFDYL